MNHFNEAVILVEPVFGWTPDNFQPEYRSTSRKTVALLSADYDPHTVNWQQFAGLDTTVYATGVTDDYLHRCADAMVRDGVPRVWTTVFSLQPTGWEFEATTRFDAAPDQEVAA